MDAAGEYGTTTAAVAAGAAARHGKKGETIHAIPGKSGGILCRSRSSAVVLSVTLNVQRVKRSDASLDVIEREKRSPFHMPSWLLRSLSSHRRSVCMIFSPLPSSSLLLLSNCHCLSACFTFPLHVLLSFQFFLVPLSISLLSPLFLRFRELLTSLSLSLTPALQGALWLSFQARNLASTSLHEYRGRRVVCKDRQ